MLFNEMLTWLDNQPPRLPVWTFSYNRAGTAPFLESMRDWASRDDIHIVVRGSQVREYREAYPWATLHEVDDAVDCVGYSRQAALDYAVLEGHELIILVDDDLTNTGWLFQGHIKSGKNAGQPCSSRTRKAGNVAEQVLTGISEVSRQVVADNPEAVLGGGVKQHGAFGDHLHRTMYRINGGVTPKQLMVAAPLRLAKAGVRLNIDLFGRHGDDIGLIAEILQSGLSCWAMPSFVYDVWSENQNILKSVVRNPDTAPALHAEEWEALQQYPIKDYLRIKRSIVDGSFEWADVDWRKYAKITGETSRTVSWPLDEARDLF